MSAAGRRTPGAPERSGALPLDECPGCGSDRIIAVSDGEDTNFLCDECGRCWHIDMGRVSRVDPYSCPGCPHRDVCTARLPQDDPSWWLPEDRATR